ncbi:hypothetical protein ACQ4PT_055070 [Festuca glaucescens]
MPSRAMAASLAGDAKEYPGKLTLYVFLTCAVAATGGLIIGYDIGISGGVTSMDTFLEKFFPSVYHKEQMAHGSSSQYCKFDSQLLTAFTSSLYLAALVASFFVASVARTFGRKWCMFGGGVSFLAGAALNGAAQNVAMLIVGRILLGVGVGFAGLSIPIYLSEMAPPRLRGTLNIGLQLMITVGIFSANLVSYGAAKIRGGWGWRPWPPRAGAKSPPRIRGTSDVADEYGDLAAATEVSDTVKRPWRDILERRYRPQLTMAVLIPFFQQLNVIMFYAPVLFKTIGLGGDAALLTAVITGLVNIVATFVSIATVDKLGRRKLFFQGGAQMGGLATAPPPWIRLCILVFICVNVAGFAWSWGPLGILVPSEIFPLEIRPAGQGINVAVNMLCTFAVAQAFLPMLCHMRSGLFYFFGGWVLLMTAFVVLFLPETKYVPIEKMTVVLTTHWFWGSFVADQDSHAQVGHGEVDVATGKLNQMIV